jgi:hypothetical protein
LAKREEKDAYAVECRVRGGDGGMRVTRGSDQVTSGSEEDREIRHAHVDTSAT